MKNGQNSHTDIKGKDKVIIENFVGSSNTLIKEINMLESNKIKLMENENLNESIFLGLDDLKCGFEVSSREFRYGGQEGIDMLKVWKNDLKGNLVDLGYQHLKWG
ncbi:MAG: hypothetical protein R3Y47_01225 [Lachnospiraceae bacterium]